MAVKLNRTLAPSGNLEVQRRASCRRAVASSIRIGVNTVGELVAKGWKIKLDLIARWGNLPLFD